MGTNHSPQRLEKREKYMTILKNGNVLCDCSTDNFKYSRCPFCHEETEVCIDCGHVKASDCEHYDIAIIGIDTEQEKQLEQNDKERIIMNT